jgi:hypothetical protein
MNKRIVAASIILLFAIVAAAQGTAQMETFLGYTYVRMNSTTNAANFSFNGGSSQYAYNFNRWISAVADLGVVHNGRIDNFPVDDTIFNFLFGPRVSLGYPRIPPYFPALFGGVYLTGSSQIDVIPAFPAASIYLPGQGGVVLPGGALTARVVTSQTTFAVTAGGGLDMKINKHFTFRPIQLEYFMTRLQNLRTQGENNHKSLRYSAGFNFTFG